MKKRSSKIIFASLGALTSISAISVGLVSCGKNTTTPPDKGIPSSSLTPEIIVPRSDITSGTEIFNSKTLMAPLTSAIKAMPKYSKINFHISGILVNDVKEKYSILSLRSKNIVIESSARVYAILITNQGQQKIETNVFYHTLTKNYNFFDISISDFTPLNPKWDTPTQAGNPFDKAWHEHQSEPVQYTAKLHTAIKNAEQDTATHIAYGELFNYHMISKQITPSKDMKTGSVIYRGFGATAKTAKPFMGGMQPFEVKITYDYAKEAYSWSNFVAIPAYNEVLSKAKLATSMTSVIATNVKVDAKDISKVDFQIKKIEHHGNLPQWDQPYADVVGIYTLNSSEYKFNVEITYDYLTKQYSNSKWSVGNKLESYFSLGKTNPAKGEPLYINPDLHKAVDKALAKKGFKVNGSLIATSGVEFPPIGYSGKVIHMEFKGVGIKDDQSTAPLTLNINYDMSSYSWGNKYRVSALVIQPTFDKVLSKDNIQGTVITSLRNSKVGKTSNLFLVDFDWSKTNIKEDANTPSITISGTAQMNGLIIKSFSETVTYDYATKAYAMSNFQITKSFNPLDNENALSAMQNYLNKANPKSKITDVTITSLGTPLAFQRNNLSKVWITITYVKDGSKTPIQEKGRLVYNFTTKDYTFTINS